VHDVEHAGSIQSGTSGGSPKSFWQRNMPRLAVYMPKYIALSNDRLSISYWGFVGFVAVAIVYYFLSNNKYLVDKEPNAKIGLCGARCALSASELDEMMVADARLCVDPAQQPGKLNYYRINASAEGASERYATSVCARRCGNGTTLSDMCLQPSDIVQTDIDTVFIPTFYAETTLTRGRSSACPLGGTPLANGLCRKQGQYWVPGVLDVSVTFSHEFSIEPDETSPIFPSSVKSGHSMSPSAAGFGDGLKTVVYDFEGNVVKEFAPGATVSLTVEQLLSAATWDDGIGRPGPGKLDEPYSRPNAGVHRNHDPACAGANGHGCPVDTDATVRLTGVSVMVDLYYTDKGFCHHYDMDKDIDVDWDGPLCCSFVHAERLWTGRETLYPIGVHGAVRYRRQQGVRVAFRTMGKVSFFDLTSVLQNITVGIVWIQIPLLLVYLFSIFCLGQLSAVYGHVIHQELKLADACKGLAARLISHSAAYMDLQDTREGISKGRLLHRFQKILESNTNIDDQEVAKFVDFVFEGMKSMSSKPDKVFNDDPSITMQEYCTACVTNEPLGFNSLVQIFDKDRKVGCFERCFLDRSVVSVTEAAKSDGRDSEDFTSYNNVNAVRYHSQLEMALTQVLELATKVNDVDAQLKRVIGECKRDTCLNDELSNLLENSSEPAAIVQIGFEQFRQSQVSSDAGVPWIKSNESGEEPPCAAEAHAT